MKTKLFPALAVTLFLAATLVAGNAEAQKTKNEKIIIRSSAGGKPMKLESLRDTTIISKDGKDTTIISTTTDGKEKKITVRKIVTSGSEKDSTLWVEAEAEMRAAGEGDHRMICKSKEGKPCTIRVVKRISKDGDSDSFVINESGPGDEDFMFDQPVCAKHCCVKVIRADGEDIEQDGDNDITIIYLNSDSGAHHRKVKKHSSKHQKIYIIRED